MKRINMREDECMIRFFSTLTTEIKKDIYVNGKLMSEEIGYMNFTEYKNFSLGKHLVEIYDSSSKELLITEVIEAEIDDILSIAINTDEEDEIFLLIIKDHLDKKASEKYSTFRTINLSKEISGIDLLVDDEILFSEISFMQGTKYVDVNIGSYHIKFRDSFSEEIIVPLKVNLKANRIYTFYIVGKKDELMIIQSVDANTYL